MFLVLFSFSRTALLLSIFFMVFTSSLLIFCVLLPQQYLLVFTIALETSEEEEEELRSVSGASGVTPQRSQPGLDTVTLGWPGS